MQKQLLLWGMVLTLLSCSTARQTLTLDAIFTKRFEHKMISSGANVPDFNTRKDSLDLFLIALHEQVPVTDFRKKAGWTETQLKEHIKFLASKNWLMDEVPPRPTVFIVTDTQGKSLYGHSIALALELSRSIESERKTIKKMYQNTELAKTHSFDELAFFILSDVLLDNWQINNIERDFLKADKRPERHGKHYYYALMENSYYPKEGFGIYGNQYNRVNDSLTVVVYGNNRSELRKQLKDDSYVQKLLETAPRISEADNRILTEMANHYRPKLIKLLVKHTDYILNVYRKTGYEQEISFEEFFIWWYHFIYTQTTNILAENNQLEIPPDGNFYYIME